VYSLVTLLSQGWRYCNQRTQLETGEEKCCCDTRLYFFSQRVINRWNSFHTKPLLHQLHWLPVQQRITYKLAVLTYKVRSSSTPVYLHHRIAERACSRTLRSATIPLLDKPFMRTDFSRCAFRFSAPTVWNSLPQTVLISDSLSVFKSRLKTFLFNQAFIEHWSDLPPAPLKLRPYGAIEIRLLLLLLFPGGRRRIVSKLL